MNKGMDNSTRISAVDNGDGTATFTFTVAGRSTQVTLDRETLLGQINAAAATLRWSSARATSQRHRLWGLVRTAVEQQLKPQSRALSGTLPSRIRVQSEEWNNGHFASDVVEVWLSATTGTAQTEPDATIEIRDLSTTIDFDVFDGCCEGAAWTLDITRAEVMPEAA